MCFLFFLPWCGQVCYPLLRAYHVLYFMIRNIDECESMMHNGIYMTKSCWLVSREIDANSNGDFSPASELSYAAPHK